MFIIFSPTFQIKSISRSQCYRIFRHRTANISKVSAFFSGIFISFLENGSTWKMMMIMVVVMVCVGRIFWLKWKYWNPFAVTCTHMKNEHYMCLGSHFNFLFHVLRWMSVNISKKYYIKLVLFGFAPLVSFVYLLFVFLLFAHSPWFWPILSFWTISTWSLNIPLKAFIRFLFGMCVISNFNAHGIYFSLISCELQLKLIFETHDRTNRR